MFSSLFKKSGSTTPNRPPRRPTTRLPRRSKRRTCPSRTDTARCGGPARAAGGNSQRSSQIGPKDDARTTELTPKVVEAISTVFDPEIPVNIYELGLIYKIEADADSRVKVEMTLTSPACPSAQQLPSEVRYKVKALEGVTDAFVEVVWEPAWTKDLMSEDAKIALGMF